ncbi:MAG TPA: hypothetical protein ENH62_02415 [Marinobacter sp.]|uniref:Uncharacterized protein n=1 Tax=marine sediment metagenome TaxID=412755 RepID=A0A0F9MQM9_9ZZZZ|nr:hypothetical protein [Marinobacter sp.]
MDWLKETCSQLRYGECRTRRCLLRGGYSGTGGFDPQIATCEEKEVLAYIKALEAALRIGLQHALDNDDDIAKEMRAALDGDGDGTGENHE